MLWTFIRGGSKVICALAPIEQQDLVTLKELIEAGVITTVVEMSRALDCHLTYAATIEAHRDPSRPIKAHLDGTGIKRNIGREAVFGLYQEAYDPPLESLFDGLTGH